MKRLSRFLSSRKSKSSAEQRPGSSQNTPVQSQPLTAPQPQAEHQRQAVLAANIAASSSQGLNIALQNQTSSSTVYAYITGRAIDNGNAWYLLQSDGRTPYYPSSPSSIMQPLAQNCAIPLGGPGNTVNVTIPHIAGGRIWFSVGHTITFFLNPGPSLVEPSVTNTSDPNAQVNWSFCEFTYNTDQLYANISYVDFVGLPISLTLNTVNSGTQHVSGMNTNGLNNIAQGLRAQHAKDGVGWDQLIVNHQGTNNVLRILSPNQGIVGNPNLFTNYYAPYVTQVYQRFSTTQGTIDTQAGFGTVKASAQHNTLTVGNSQFPQPSTRDIFTCSTGPFATGSNAETNVIIPRLAAAFNRSTLLETTAFPAPSSFYYKNAITNHYSRIVHENNLDGKGYAFPYDDVQPTNGPDQSGEVHAGDPKLFTIAVGGNNAYV